MWRAFSVSEPGQSQWERQELAATVIHDVMSMFEGEEDDILSVCQRAGLFRSSRRMIRGKSQEAVHRPWAIYLTSPLAGQKVSAAHHPHCISLSSQLADLMTGDAERREKAFPIIQGV